MFKFYIYKIGQFIVNHLSIKAAYRFAMFCSTFQYYFSPRDQKAVKENLQVILKTNRKVSHEAREVFRNFGKYLVEFFRMAKDINREYINKYVKIENMNYLTDALKKNKGGIILTAHIGNWELGGVILSLLGFPCVAIALSHKEGPVNKLFNQQRESKGITVVQINGAFRKCLTALQENKLIALLADRDFTLHGEVLDFLGKKSIIPRGAAVFSMSTGAPIIPVFFLRDTKDHFLMQFEEPIYPEKNESEKETILSIMKKYTVLIEKKIREYPTQWLMFRRFWI